jgi:poly(A) polymerase
LREAAIRLIRRLQDAGHEAYFAGGCVRDHLLGREPKDFDIATSARPREVRALFPRSGVVGAHFGVVLVHEPEADFEIATFRADGVYLDGRRPMDVRYSSAEEDARRRDFTINGLFQDPVSGAILDHVGGQEDLRAGIIRAIGRPEDRFREDHLRLMRAVRFATELGFALDPETLAAVSAEAPSIRIISAERTRDELVRILDHPRRAAGFDLLVGTGLLAEILPEVIALCGCALPVDRYPEGDAFVHTRRMVGLLPPEAGFPLVMAVLLHDVAKPATARRESDGALSFDGHEAAGAVLAGDILRRLKCSNEVIDAVVEAVARHGEFDRAESLRIADLKRFLARPRFAEELELHRVNRLASDGDLSHHAYLRRKHAEFPEPLVPPRLVSGKELLAAGWSSGPRLKEVLDAIQDEQLEGRLHSGDAAIAWAEERFPKP